MHVLGPSQRPATVRRDAMRGRSAFIGTGMALTFVVFCVSQMARED